MRNLTKDSEKGERVIKEVEREREREREREFYEGSGEGSRSVYIQPSPLRESYN